MSNLSLSFLVTADVGAALKGVAGMAAQLVAAAGAATAFGAALKKGFAVNSEMENVTLGLKGIIASLQDVRDAGGKPATGLNRLAIAGEEAERQMKLLRVASMQTSAEFTDLAKAFQTALGAGSSAGLGVDQIRELTVSLVLAAGAFNLGKEQLSSEIRAMLTGDQVDNSEIARGLGIFSGAQIKKWREAGTLVTELNKRLENFKLMGEEAGKTWSATLSNLGDGIALFLGQTTKGAFDSVKTSLQDALSGGIDQDGNIKAEFQGLADFAEKVFGTTGDVMASAINGAVDAAKDLSAWFVANNQTVSDIFDTLGRIVGVLNTAASLVGDLAGQTSGVGSAAKFVNAALNGVAVVMAIIVDTAKGLAGVIGYTGGVIANALLDPLTGVSRLLSKLTGKDLSSGIEKIQAETNKFKSAAKDYGMNAFKFDTAKRVAAEIEAAYKASPIHAILNPENKKPTGGTVSAPKAPKADDKKAKKDAERAAGQYRDALRAYEDKKAEADKQLAEVTRNAALRDLDTSLKDRLITQAEYLKKKAALDQQEIEQELTAARNREAAIEKQMAAQPDKAKNLKLQGDLLKVKAEIKAIEDKGAAVPVRLRLELKDFEEQVQSLKIDIQANILDSEGHPYEAAVQRLAKETQDMLQDARVRGDAEMEALVNRQSTNKQAQLDLAEAKRILDDKAAYTALTAQRIARDVEAGRMTQVEAEKALQAEHAKTKEAIEAYIAVLERLAAAYPDNQAFALSLAQARDQLGQVTDKANEAGVALQRSFASGFVSALDESIRQAKTFTDVVRGMFFKLFDAIAAKALEKLTANLFAGMAGGTGFLGGIGSFVAGAGKLLGFADGGHVTGPGTGTSDSIPAWLSNGEFVLKAATVRRLGVGFLNSLNAGATPRQLTRQPFSEGGFASMLASARGAAPQVTVQNNNTSRVYFDLADIAAEIGQTPEFGRHVIQAVIANKRKLGMG